MDGYGGTAAGAYAQQAASSGSYPASGAARAERRADVPGPRRSRAAGDDRPEPGAAARGIEQRHEKKKGVSPALIVLAVVMVLAAIVVVVAVALTVAGVWKPGV